MKVYCINCKYFELFGHECNYPDNLIWMEGNVYYHEGDYRQISKPKKINKNLDCNWYKNDGIKTEREIKSE
jgi:hypothetical protein